MPAVRLDRFIGRIPRISSQNLPDNAATVADNVRLLSGNLRAIHIPEPIEAFEFGFAYTPQNIFRLLATTLVDDNPDLPGPNVYPEDWVGLRYAGSSMVKGPVTKDQYERYYWTDEGQNAPRYARRGIVRDIEVNPSFGNILGIPAPTTAPTVTPSGTGETRSYVYTFVSVYGEEGPPSPPTEATGDPALPWDITNMEVNGDADREIDQKRIYRTVVSGSGATDFIFVTQIDNTTTSYLEPGNNNIAGNEALPSATWLPPPATLDGLVAHPNGFLVGFSGFDVYMSEVFQPHAWPDEYVISVDTPIVALAIVDTSVVVLTQGSPHILSGIAPDSMAKTSIKTAAPCLSRYSVVVMPDGVYYASNMGIARVVAESVSIVTQGLIDSERWRVEFSPETIKATKDQEYYMAFTSQEQGFLFAPGDAADTLVNLRSFSNIDNVHTDRLDGQVYLVQNGRVLRWDPPNGVPLTYQWRSKEIVFPEPCNMAAAIVDFDADPRTVTRDLTYFQSFNTARLASGPPFAPLNYAPLGASRYISGLTPDDPQNRLPLGGSSFFNLSTLAGPGAVQLNVYARDKLVFAKLVVTEALNRLPADVKSDKWQFELVGNTDVFYLKVAETGKQLATV